VPRIAASGGGGGGGGGDGGGGDDDADADGDDDHEGRTGTTRRHAVDVHRTSCTYRPALVDDVVCPGNDVPPVPFRDKPSAVTRPAPRANQPRLAPRSIGREPSRLATTASGHPGFAAADLFDPPKAGFCHFGEIRRINSSTGTGRFAFSLGSNLRSRGPTIKLADEARREIGTSVSAHLD